MKRVVVLFVFLCSVIIASAQNRVIVSEKNGNTTVGTIIEDNSEFIRIEKYDDKLIRIIYRSNIVNIANLSSQREKEILAEQNSNNTKFSYDQYAHIAYRYNRVTDFLGVHYIGGCRFNNSLFLGIGTGVDFALFSPKMPQQYVDVKPSSVSVPIYLNFRANILDKTWSPYVAASLGARISRKIANTHFVYNPSGFFGDIVVGVERKIVKRLSAYLGLGYRIESFLFNPLDNVTAGRFYSNKMEHGFNIYIGLSF